MLTVLADISVLVSKVPWQTPFKLISADDLRNNNRSDNMKIVSKLNLEVNGYQILKILKFWSQFRLKVLTH